MKDKTITFGIFYDIFAGLSILSSPPRPVQRQKTSHLVLAVRPHPLHYIIRTIKCFTAETERVTRVQLGTKIREVFTVPGGGPY